MIEENPKAFKIIKVGKASKPVINAEEDIKKKLEEKARLFEQWIKNMGYWPE